jgi:rhamnulokinase
MSGCYLAIDIGASSGRHILGYVKDGALRIEEIHRFKNQATMKNGTLVWDLDSMFQEILTGLKKCGDSGRAPLSVGIDTWGVDFVLLDKAGNVLGDTVAYRDGRTIGVDEEVFSIVSEGDIYALTGIAKQQFNTIFQLMAIKRNNPELLSEADRMLFVPDYFNYLLSGESVNEYTIASTSGLLNAFDKDWDKSLIDRLGFPQKLFQKLKMPGSYLGWLTNSVQKEVGFGAKVSVPATHDTGSAFAAVPDLLGDSAYISSGTWSLMGTCVNEPNTSKEAMLCGFTNEGACAGQLRLLKNIMGLWMIQEISREFEGRYSFAELCKMAEMESIKSIVNCNDVRFLAPKSMRKEIRDACWESGQQAPETPRELAAVIYNSLAVCYADTLKELEKLSGKSFSNIRVVGGGANADYLNRLTAKATGKTVIAGPIEATAIGNIALQMMMDGELSSLSQAKEMIGNSFDLKTFNP